jgi:hypothetical protein
MEWILLIEKIIELIQKCRENRSRSEIEGGLKRPGRLERWALRRVLKQETNLRGRVLRDKVDEGIDELRSLDADDIEFLMDEAEK